MKILVRILIPDCCLGLPQVWSKSTSDPALGLGLGLVTLPSLPFGLGLGLKLLSNLSKKLKFFWKIGTPGPQKIKIFFLFWKSGTRVSWWVLYPLVDTGRKGAWTNISSTGPFILCVRSRCTVHYYSSNAWIPGYSALCCQEQGAILFLPFLSGQARNTACAALIFTVNKASPTPSLYCCSPPEGTILRNMHHVLYEYVSCALQPRWVHLFN